MDPESHGVMSQTHETTLMTRNPEETQAVGFFLGGHLKGGEVIALSGDLGSGKTCFVKGLGLGLEIVPEEITSPTYTIIHEHRGRLPLIHVDLYRIEQEDAVEALGLVDFFGEDRVTVIEWPEKALSLFPQENLKIQFLFGNSDQRKIYLESFGNIYHPLVDGLILKFQEILCEEADESSDPH